MITSMTGLLLHKTDRERMEMFKNESESVVLLLYTNYHTCLIEARQRTNKVSNNKSFAALCPWFLDKNDITKLESCSSSISKLCNIQDMDQ